MKNKLATENLEITKREKAHNEIVRNAAKITAFFRLTKV